MALRGFAHREKTVQGHGHVTPDVVQPVCFWQGVCFQEVPKGWRVNERRRTIRVWSMVSRRPPAQSSRGRASRLPDPARMDRLQPCQWRPNRPAPNQPWLPRRPPVDPLREHSNR